MVIQKENKKYELTIIYVNYKCHHVLEESLISLINQKYSNYIVFIVDNTPGNKEYLKIKKTQEKFKNNFKIVLLKPKYNLGYAGGNNYAIKRSYSKYILLLNCDTELAPNFLQKSIDYLNSNPQVGLLSPKMLYFRYKNLIWYAGAYLNPKSFVFTYHLGRNQKDSDQYNQIKETAYANGTALFVRRDVIKIVGLMDEIFFMYVEEVDWNYRARKSNYKIIYFPKAVVYHKTPLITKKYKSQFRENPFKLYLSTRNIFIFTFKHFSLKVLILFLLIYPLKATLIESLLSIKIIPEFISSQIRAFYYGLLIGIRRRTNRSCKKIMIKEMKYLNKFEKISRSTQK